jgi:hypothetical protein
MLSSAGKRICAERAIVSDKEESAPAEIICALNAPLETH